MGGGVETGAATRGCVLVSTKSPVDTVVIVWPKVYERKIKGADGGSTKEEKYKGREKVQKVAKKR